MIQFNITVEELKPGLIAVACKCDDTKPHTSEEIHQANTLSELLNRTMKEFSEKLGSARGNCVEALDVPLSMQSKIDEILNSARLNQRFNSPQA